MGIKNIFRGDTKIYRFDITDADEEPVNISTHFLYFTMKENAEDADVDAVVAIKATMPSNAESVAGIGRITVPSDVTDLLVPGQTYYYDFQYVVPGVPPYVQTLQSGKVKVQQDVTVANT